MTAEDRVNGNLRSASEARRSIRVWISLVPQEASRERARKNARTAGRAHVRRKGQHRRSGLADYCRLSRYAYSPKADSRPWWRC